MESSFTLITGASSGIGLELAKICAKKKQNLILVARREEKLKNLQQELQKQFAVEVKVIGLDLSKTDAAQKLDDATRELNVQILINNAGFGSYGLFLETDLQKELNMIDLNMRTLTELCKRFGKRMKPHSGCRIMNVASAAGFQPGPLMAVYYATKAYVLHFTEALAEELKAHEISVTALCPGATASEFQERSDMDKSELVKEKKLPSSKEVAEYGFQAMMTGKVVAVHGLSTKLMIFAERFVPRSFIRKMVMRLQKEAQ